MQVKVIALMLSVLSGPAPAEPPGTGWGEPATPEEIVDASLLVMPDGQGLPAGSGTAAVGESLYALHCIACHGSAGSGGTGGALAGGMLDGTNPSKTVGSYWPYAAKIFDYIRRAMPYGTPAALSSDEYYALTAYILYVNDLVSRNDRIDRDNLPAIVMPNADGFISAYPSRPAEDQNEAD